MKQGVLLLAMLASGFCGMIAEYSVSTMVGYLVGNTIAAFTIIIAVFMFAMAIGSLFSQKIKGAELEKFLGVELVLSFFAASSTVFIARATQLDLEWEASYLISSILGFAIGFEIPLLMRINKQFAIFEKNVAAVFAADYLGSFLAGCLFAPFLLPAMGPVNTAVLGGALNVSVAIMMILTFRSEVAIKKFSVLATATALLVSFFALTGERFVFHIEQAAYSDLVTFSYRTKYQKIVVTEDPSDRKNPRDFCLYLNGHTQYCSQDEARYHEMLVHPAFAVAPYAQSVLVLGGGDGIAVREILKHKSVQKVQLVDLDPEMVELCSGKMKGAEDIGRRLTALNGNSFDDPRVSAAADDAFVWLGKSDKRWDIIIVDFPDPRNPELAKLYSKEFYLRLKKRLNPTGVAVVQSTSPIHAPKPFRMVGYTMEDAGLTTVPYRVNVPSFGDWGFHLAQRKAFASRQILWERLNGYHPSVKTRFLNNPAIQAAIRWEKGMWDTGEKRVVSRLARPSIHLAYEKSWDVE